MRLGWLGRGGAVLLLALSGCGDDSTPGRDGGMDSALPDTGGPDTFVEPECETDDDCDDEVDCTRDVCDDRGICQQIVERAACDDGVFCNGLELCDPLEGCMPGPIETCSDGDVCTIDSCDEEEKICRSAPRDFDEDGEADWFCEGGTDCDDRDPTRGSTIAEVCDDEIDNDCDEMVDESDCGRPRYDVCDDPLDVSAGGFFEISSDGASPDLALGCAPSGRRDLVLTFTLEEPKGITVRAEGRSITYVALRTTCDDRDTETQCASGFPGQIRARSLEAGTYFVLIADIGGDVLVEVDIDEPIPPPPNEDCESAIDVSAGGSFPGTFVDVADDLTTSCGSTRAPELTWEFTTTEVRDVLLSAVTETGDSISLSVQSTCGDADSELRCVRGSPAGTRLYQLPAGTYTIITEGSSTREVDFTLDVAFEDPTPPPAGDTCGNAIAISPGDTVTGTLSDKQDDVAIACGFFFRDAVYELTLTETSDVTIEADADGPFMYLSVRSDCEDDDSRLRCVSGNPARSRLRNLSPGTYFLVVESFSGTGYSLSVDASPPTVPTPASGNSLCEDAVTIPLSGGLFTGTTVPLLNDYETRSCGSNARSRDAAFRLDLTTRQRVVASTEGSDFDTVLHRHVDSCASEGEATCDDDGGEASTSLLDEELDPGTYFYIVDGWGSTNNGEYFFEVQISDP
ncbi:MAG: putative metal-binding motif-containing protein [Myxococcota bacterium]